MWTVIFEYLNIIKILIFGTFIYGILNLKGKKSIYKLIFILVTISLLSEMTNSILNYYKKPIGLSITIYVIIHNSFWLFLLQKTNFINLVHFKILLSLFLVFSVINLWFFEKIEHFNYQTFVVSALLYLSIFIFKSYLNLQNENFIFFKSNEYLLLCAPVLFFIGLSFMFSFKSKALTSFIVFNEVKLYKLINYFVNIIYYTLINIYIYRERKLKNA